MLVRVEDADAHCRRAREHGAASSWSRPTSSTASAQYEADDLAGHHWTFSQTLRDAAPEEWGGDDGRPLNALRR